MNNAQKSDITYFELLSFDPICVPGAGGILCPRLTDISAIGFQTYQYYLSILLLNEKSMLKTLTSAGYADLVLPEKTPLFHAFDLMMMHESSALLLKDVLDFFIKEDVVYAPEQHCFLTQTNNGITGAVTKENYSQICNVILLRNNIRHAQKEDASKVKSKKASEILKKLQAGRAKKVSETGADENLELGNIISAVANKSLSLNIQNIWDITIFQLWDCFARLSNNSIYDIQSMSVAAWGSKDNSFDASAWYKRIYTEN